MSIKILKLLSQAGYVDEYFAWNYSKNPSLMFYSFNVIMIANFIAIVDGSLDPVVFEDLYTKMFTQKENLHPCNRILQNPSIFVSPNTIVTLPQGLILPTQILRNASAKI